MGFLKPNVPRRTSNTGLTGTPILDSKGIGTPGPPPSRTESSVLLAGLRSFRRSGVGSTSQIAATSTKSGGVFGSRSLRNKRKRSLIGGSA